MHSRILLTVALALAGTVAADADTWHNGDLTTYTQGSWGGDPSLDPGATLLEASYDTVYASTFGLVTVGSSSGFTMRFTDASSVLAYEPAVGPFKPLDGNVLNPITNASGGLGGEVLGLELNVDFSDAGLLPGASGLRFGDLVLENFTAVPVFNGMTVRQFLGDVNLLLSGEATSFSIADLGSTVGDLNASFSEGTASAFAQAHLVAPPSVGAVPEPSSWLLGIAGVLGLALGRRSKGFRTQKRRL